MKRVITKSDPSPKHSCLLAINMAMHCYHNRSMTHWMIWLWRLLPGNPVFNRIVHTGSRRLRHLWVRMIYLGVLILLVLFGLLTSGGLAGDISLIDLAKAGALIFAIIAYGQVVLVCLFAPLFMAGAIAEEQAGETYDILLTTPLSNLQIVLGSLAGRLFFVLSLLFSGLPLFAVLLIFGGVTFQSVMVAFSVAGLTAIAMGSVAITLSVFRIGGRRAVFVFIIVVAAYLIGAYALDVLLLRQFTLTPGSTTWLTPLHPLLVLEASINRANYQPPLEMLEGYSRWVRFYMGHPFATFSLLSVGSSALLLLIASFVVRVAGRGDSKFFFTIRRALRLHRDQDPEGRRSGREVSNNPIAWREANTRGNAPSGIVLRGLFVLLGVFLSVVLVVLYHTGALPNLNDPFGAPYRPDQVFRSLLISLLLIEISIISLIALYMSASCVSREREDGTLDLILTTPVTPRQYLWGKLRGLVRFLNTLIALPILTLAVASGYTILGYFLNWPQTQFSTMYISSSHGTVLTQNAMLVPPEAPLLLLMTLVPFVALCVAVGMTWSLRSRGVIGAIIPSVLIIGIGTATLAMCGWSAAASIPFVGPFFNAFSPVTNLLMMIEPWDEAQSAWGGVALYHEHPILVRSLIAGACAVSAAAYGAIVYALVFTMIRGFDHTVRRLSGA